MRCWRLSSAWCAVRSSGEPWETYAVFLPTLGRAFGWAQVEATLVYAVLHLGAGFASFPLGRVYDR